MGSGGFLRSKGGRPRRKAAQENKAAKDTEDPLVKLERAVGLLDRGLLSVGLLDRGLLSAGSGAAGPRPLVCA